MPLKPPVQPPPLAVPSTVPSVSAQRLTYMENRSSHKKRRCTAAQILHYKIQKADRIQLRHETTFVRICAAGTEGCQRIRRRQPQDQEELKLVQEDV
ncbi:hypothetical protein JOB18_012791 [Solea senegalensis]|uniref:Uncharacterized protein n=1 Tax=Solea senegalensis TaxID=28829 RepID=A0AAV6Q824_SOLSE|nr:hypothetical protein JOB18_012791 [Solea senegalensis]